jgi:hypothetical protein
MFELRSRNHQLEFLMAEKAMVVHSPNHSDWLFADVAALQAERGFPEGSPDYNSGEETSRQILRDSWLRRE